MLIYGEANEVVNLSTIVCFQKSRGFFFFCTYCLACLIIGISQIWLVTVSELTSAPYIRQHI